MVQPGRGSRAGEPGGNKNQGEYWKRINRARSRTRARGEHPFRVVKPLQGFTKTRDRGIAKHPERAQTMSASANLHAVRHELIPREARAAL
ncbi:MAG TPA: hypothetical protein ENI85_05545 [Deltaproteobacteria bacterium]|nr:hypothetical protein [Deltaproteobacteria bacterium]